MLNDVFEGGKEEFELTSVPEAVKPYVKEALDKVRGSLEKVGITNLSNSEKAMILNTVSISMLAAGTNDRKLQNLLVKTGQTVAMVAIDMMKERRGISVDDGYKYLEDY